MIFTVLQPHWASATTTKYLSVNSKKVSLVLTFLCLIGQVAFAQPVAVTPSYETQAVITKGDAADDSVIWVNPANTAQSMVLGTDKKSGVYAYGLDASTLGYSKLGKINNIDSRTIGEYSFIFASNRTQQSVDVWIFGNHAISNSIAKGAFSLPVNRSMQGQSAINIYGICAGIDPELGLLAFVTEDEGPRVEVWQYTAEALSLIHTFDNGGESEGCVYDDENRTLFISEEEVNGVLRAYQVSAELDFSQPIIVDSRQGNINGDPEGVTLYKTSSTDGYVILSSQGDSKFNLYQRTAPYEYLGSFIVADRQLEDGTVIDGTSITDGIDAANINFNPDFPEGLIVIQDNDNMQGKRKKRQNFKYVSFAQVLDALELR